MNNQNELLETLRQLVAADNIIPLTEIPNIDLYVDQITTFMEDKLSGTKRDDKDKLITKTMINNYTKDKILPPPVKKKYSRQHLITLIIMYYLKPILNITDIGRLLNNRETGLNMEELYEKFTQLQRDAADLPSWMETIASKMDGVGHFSHSEKLLAHATGMEGEEEEKLLLLVLDLVVEANIRKQMAEKIIDRYFTEKSR